MADALGGIWNLAKAGAHGLATVGSPGYAERYQKEQSDQLNLYLSILGDRTGRYSPQAQKAAEDSALKLPIMRDMSQRLGGGQLRGRGWGGGMGIPKGMIPTKVEVGKEGGISRTFEPEQRFGPIPGALGLVPEERRAGVAEKFLVKPTTQVNIGDQKQITNTLALRREFQGDSRIKDMRTIDKFTANVVSAYKRSLTSKNLGPVDISLAKSFQKLTDLGSSVREGEFATTFAGQKLINKLIGKAQAVVKGGLGFTQEDRKEIMDLVLILQKDSQKMYNQAYDEFSVTADEFGFNKRAIFGGTEKYDISEAEGQGAGQQPILPVPSLFTPEQVEAELRRRGAIK